VSTTAFTNIPNGAACNDHSACTQTDTCQSGSCVGGSSVTCTALDQCHIAGTCNPTNGTCSNPSAPNGTACSDGNGCTQTDTCQNGSCAGGSPVICTALDQCHIAGTCNTATGTCSNPNAANGVSCEDGNPCNQPDTCQAGICTGSNTADTDCSGTCVDLASDPNNCGSCGNVCPAPAGSGDDFGLGNGSSGSLSSPTGNTVINDYASITSVTGNPVTSVSISTSDLTKFDGSGVLVMLWNPKGYPAPTPGAAGPFDLSTNATGQWELARVVSRSASTITFAAPLTSGFSANVTPGVTQVIRVPEYTTVNVPAGSSIVAGPWNGLSGGVLAFLANGAVTLDGNIGTDGAGLAGGVHNGFANNGGVACTLSAEGNTGGLAGAQGENISSTQGFSHFREANGGGGGLCENTGGGGGGNGGVGGDGEVNGASGLLPGQGGAKLLYSMLDHFEFGAGGGSGQLTTAGATSTDGDGGAGGGVVWFRAASVGGTGTINANGRNAPTASSGGGGGGGAGGSISIRLTGNIFNCNNLHAHGGAGGSGGVKGGGGGGGGRVFVQSANSCTSADVSGGVKGSAGAGAGGNATEDSQPGGGFCLSNENCSDPTPLCIAGICTEAPMCVSGACQ
jgi:hypothetical protein